MVDAEVDAYWPLTQACLWIMYRNLDAVAAGSRRLAAELMQSRGVKIHTEPKTALRLLREALQTGHLLAFDDGRSVVRDVWAACVPLQASDTVVRIALPAGSPFSAPDDPKVSSETVRALWPPPTVTEVPAVVTTSREELGDSQAKMVADLANSIAAGGFARKVIWPKPSAFTAGDRAPAPRSPAPMLAPTPLPTVEPPEPASDLAAPEPLVPPPALSPEPPPAVVAEDTAPPVKRTPGRRPGQGAVVGDDALVEEARELVRTGVAGSKWDAAGRVSDRAKGASPGANQRRLYRKLNKILP